MKLFKHPLTYIFLFSLFMHWQNIGISNMEGPDNPRDYERAVQTSNGEYFPISGIEINYLKKTVRTPGGFVYLLMSIPHLFTDHPYAAVIFLGLLSSLTILVVFFMTREMNLLFMGGVLPCLFMTVNLNVNIFSREVFAPNYVLLFGALFFWVLYRAVQKPQSASQIFLLPLFALTSQIDLAHLALGLAMLCCFIFFRIKPSLQYQLLGLLICFLLYTPYILYLFQHNFQDIRDILMNIRSDLFFDHPQNALKAFLWTFLFAVPIPFEEYMFLLGKNFYETDIFRFMLLGLSVGFGLIAFVYPIMKFLKNDKKTLFKKPTALSFILICVASVITVNLLRMADCHARYLYTIIPLIAILKTMGVEYLHHEYKTGIKKMILYGLAVIFFITSISEFSKYLCFVKDNAFGTTKDYLNAISYMQSESNNNYQVVSEMDPSDLNALYMLAKYHYKALPKHPKGIEHFAFNYIELPLSDHNTVKFYFHREDPYYPLPENISKQTSSFKRFGTIQIFRLK